MDSSPMKLRWLQVVNGVLLQKKGRESEHLVKWMSAEVKDRVDVSNFEGERKTGFQRRNTLGSSNCAGNIKVSRDGKMRGFTNSKRCSGEFDFMVTGKDFGEINLETRSDPRLEQEDKRIRKEFCRKDTIWKRHEVFRPGHGDIMLEYKRHWLEKRSLTVLDERMLMDPSVCKDAEVIRGQMWVQRSSLFAQWKERHLVLRGRVLEVHRLEGGLVCLIGLSQVKRLELTERRGTLAICVSLDRGNFYLRRADGLDDWFRSLGDGIKENKREKDSRLCPTTREEPKITLEELTRLYREEEDEEVEKMAARRRGRRDFETLKEADKDIGIGSLVEKVAMRRGRRNFGLRSETLKEADKDSGIGSLQSNSSLPPL